MIYMSASSLSKEKKILNIDWKWMSSCLCVLAFGWSDVRASFFLRMISTRYPSIQTLLFADWSWVGSYSHCESVWPYSSCWKNPTKRKWTNKCKQSQDGSYNGGINIIMIKTIKFSSNSML